MNLQNKFKEKFSNSHNKREIKKQQRFYENMITSSDENSTSIIFNKTSLAWLIVLVTLLLQLISLATTYKGSIVYFGGINLPFNLSAPLLFALSIQLIVFCVSHTLRSNFRKGFLIVLILATLCSTYFSYIGIYNYINSPLNYLEERYTQINSNISDKYETLRETNKSSITKTMLNLINDLSTSYASLSMEVDNNNKLSEDIANISIDNNIINSQTNSVSKPNINNYGDNLDQYYSDMAKYNAAIGNMITDSTKQDSSLKNELYNAQVNSILGGKSLDEFTAESIDTKSKKEQLEKGVNTSYTLISSEENSLTIDEKLLKIQDYCQNYIQGINGDKDIFTTILLNLNSQILIIKNESSIDNLQTQINEFLILNKKDSDIMKSFSDLKSIVYTNSTGNNYSDNVTLTEENAMELYSLMNSEVKSALYTLNHISSNTEKINSNNEDYIIHNLYVLPVLNLFTLNEEISMSWFCLIFAILIDGLTIIFAIMEGKEKTPLFAKSTKEVVGRSKDSIENLLMLSLLSSDIDSRDEERVEKILLKLKNFVSSFNLLTEALENGYSMYCPLSSLEEYQGFLATLCQFNLATIISSKELFFNDQTPDIQDENFVLIKTKFMIWANDKIVSLTLNNQYIDSLNKLDENYIMNGELL
ncbi:MULTISPECIES: hypothetical protein [unclassified Clostridium]|uniref:hypothetical protein n=1 Tax=Clostridium TaxID=1485 RepID=UPI001C8B395A|nr:MULTISPECIES: hypothetical protein [unclassified Clostridium]MBX9138259.1 hypothetical protein [Clostridium sp. K12(2020)]MBX9144975.1 hypothetical protein [Clostridium sp. K13]MDU4325397.1 hypothetical protein [Clostridium celatum]